MGTVLVLSLIAAPLASIGAWLRRRDRLRFLLMIAVLAAAGLWLAIIGIALTGWRDLDGAVDCWPHCDPGQQTVRIAFWLFPGLALVLSLAATASLLLRR